MGTRLRKPLAMAILWAVVLWGMFIGGLSYRLDTAFILMIVGAGIYAFVDKVLSEPDGPEQTEPRASPLTWRLASGRLTPSGVREVQCSVCGQK